MCRKIHVLVTTLAVGCVSGTAAAHVSITSGPGIADTSQIVTFSIGHGCEGADTLKLSVEIPSEITSLRTASSTLGPARLELDDAGLPVAVSWEKPVESLLEGDTGYYSASIRFRVPNAPFTTLYFPAHQVCQTADGEILEVDWVGTEPEAGDEHSEGGGEEPAPGLLILPQRFPGWNKFTVPSDISNLATFFSDALIVWKRDAAYSPNPTTTELIAGTDGVKALTELQAGDEIWVKY